MLFSSSKRTLPQKDPEEKLRVLLKLLPSLSPRTYKLPPLHQNNLQKHQNHQHHPQLVLGVVLGVVVFVQ